ncbi:MAG: transposase [Kiritimatiellia bacterium]
MARPLRIQFPGAIYHVNCRMIGDNRSRKPLLFVDARDRRRFLDNLSEYVEQHKIRLYLFVLMLNHFHLVFETPQANCSRFMQSLSTAYAVYYNLRHDRHGHLLDGRYKAKLVEGDRYLLALTRYVHLNPACVEPLKNKSLEERQRYLREYPWSTYQGYVHSKKRMDFVEYEPMLAQMKGKRTQWPGRYRQFVESGLAKDEDEFILELNKSPRSIGSDDFRAWIDDLHYEMLAKHASLEDISFRHTTEPLLPEAVLQVLSQVFKVRIGEFKQRKRGSVLRALAARFLLRYSAASQREIAVLLNAGSGSAISKQISRHAELISADKKLAKQVRRTELVLEKMQKERSKKNSKVLSQGLTPFPFP